MTIPQAACDWAIKTAKDQKHGYSQANRWGSPDYDCSSFTISAFRNAGVPIDINKVNYTGNMSGLLNYGFSDVTKKVNLATGSGLQPGDILFYHKSGTNGHAAIYIGDGKIVHARGASYGSTKPGDQGTEIAVAPYYRGSFDHVYRYTGGGSAPAVKKRYNVTTTLPIVKYGSVGRAVMVWQTIIGVESDGEFGPNTKAATIQFQKANQLEQDAEVGPLTWASGLKSIS